MQAPPPVYNKNQQRNEQEGFILNLTPLPTKVTFRTGIASIEGELQFKLLQITKFSFQELKLELMGIEKNSSEQNQLIHSIITFWKNETDNNSAVPPSLSPFNFNLPNHLPQCIHLQNRHGINYKLTATLTYQDHHSEVLQKSTLTIPIHITKPTTNDLEQEQQQFSLLPVEIKAFEPTPIFVTLSQTLLCHSKPLALQIRIPPPVEQLINDKGLQLRSVRAELRKHICDRSNPENQVTAVLAISGKSCRFSSSRAVFLRLRLHSNLSQTTRGRNIEEIGVVNGEQGERLGEQQTAGILSQCETVSQTTNLFKVSFSVVVQIQISTASGDHHGTREDVELIQEVGMLPEQAPCSTPLVVPGKAKEAGTDEQFTYHDTTTMRDGGPGPAPRYLETEQSQDIQQASTSQLNGLDLQRIGPTLDWQEEEEEEYDGYECFSAMVGQDGPAPPTIDEDESPPPAPDTPPEGLELRQSPILVQPSDLNQQYLLPNLHQLHSINPCDLHHQDSFSMTLTPLPSPPLISSPPSHIDSAHPPAYAPGWTPPSIPQLPTQSARLLSPPPPPQPSSSSETSSLEPPPYVANCS
ncbi:hypothetical protein MJO29_000909 [Puccinia striiformis f. sp. tritici]|nr:hypothetical protein MJO29_000909 [Puccinia striiformis f. sp. tritici]